MAKRFTDTNKWSKPFLRGMKAPYKLLWLYLLDECDHAGIWQVDFSVAQIKIGEKIQPELAYKFLCDRVIAFDNGEKWFIPDFIEFQYGVLKPENRAHNSVIKQLQKYNLINDDLTIHKPLTSPLQGAKDKDKDKDMDKDKDKDKGGVGEKLKTQFAENVFLADAEHRKLIEEFGEVETQWMIGKLSGYKLSHGKTYKSDYGAIRNWVVDELLKMKKLNQNAPKQFTGQFKNEADRKAAERDYLRAAIDEKIHGSGTNMHP